MKEKPETVRNTRTLETVTIVETSGHYEYTMKHICKLNTKEKNEKRGRGKEDRKKG